MGNTGPVSQVETPGTPKGHFMITSDDVTIDAPRGEPDPGETVHPLACFHRKWHVDYVKAQGEYNDAMAALEATFSPEQKQLRALAERAGDWYVIADVDRFVEDLARHFPGLAPAIRAVAYHVEERMPGDPVCCDKPMGTPIYATEA